MTTDDAILFQSLEKKINRLIVEVEKLAKRIVYLEKRHMVMR